MIIYICIKRYYIYIVYIYKYTYMYTYVIFNLVNQSYFVSQRPLAAWNIMVLLIRSASFGPRFPPGRSVGRG
jgi:hypothetical protein